MIVGAQRLPAERWQEGDEFEPLTYEKVVGLNNLLSIAWLGRGLELAAAVVRLVTPSGPAGSGFLIAPDLLMTNHHVLPDAAFAETAVAEFNFQTNWAGEQEPVRRYTLDSAHFRNNQELDYAMVRVRDGPGDLFGYIDVADRAEATVNDFVSVIQHPNGGPKQVCFTDNKVAAVFDNRVQYSTDTEPGSSGSPVFNQNWQLVALHHAGGGLAGPNGTKYFTNEGIQIGAILRDARDFLALPDALYDLAFGELRGTLVRLIAAGPTDDLAGALLRERPRFSRALDDYVKLYTSGDAEALPGLAGAGVATGAALRQWARTSGHESIESAASSKPAPAAGLKRMVGRFKGSNDLPADVYSAVIAALREQRDLSATIVSDGEAAPPVQGRARAYLTGVSVGASAYDGPTRRRSGGARRRSKPAG